MPERREPNLDQVREALREHDERAEEPAPGKQPERHEPGPAEDEPDEPVDADRP